MATGNFSSGAEDRAPFLLVEAGRAKAVIVTADHPTPVEQEAVEELNEWVGKITGATLPVVTASARRASGDATPYVAIGRHALTREASKAIASLAPESARVVITPETVLLVGNDTPPQGADLEWRGTYYAVRELVEKRLGVRLVWPGRGGEVYRRTKTVALPCGQWNWEPKLTLSRWMRGSYSERLREQMEALLPIDIDDEAWAALRSDQEQWLKRHRMNQPSYVKFGHAFTGWWERFSKLHPDWFARPPAGISQRGGRGVKLNVSHPGVAQQILEDWKLQRQQSPLESTFLTVCPNDSRGYCTRPENRAWDPPATRAMTDGEVWSSDKAVVTDRYVRFANLIARRAAAIDPEVTVTTYAYRNYRKPPVEVEVDPHVLIAYVGGEGYYPDERFIVDEWKAWAAKGATLYWRPNLLQAGHGMPYLYAGQLRDDFAVFLENRMLGTNFDSITGNWGGQGLNYYVAAQMHFRPEARYETLLDEYVSAFGPASETVKAYLRYFEEATRKGPGLLRDHRLVSRETWGGWWQGFIRLVPLFMTQERIRHGRELLSRAQEEVAGQAPVFGERVAFLRRSLEHSALMAEVFSQVDFTRSPGSNRAVLAKLWKARLAALNDLSIPSVRLLLEEQRQFGLWDAFRPAVRQARNIRLTSGWTIKADPEGRGLKENWAASPASQEGWEPVSVGMPWAQTAAGKAILADTRFPESRKTVWYRREIELPELDDTSQRLALRFGAVDAEVKVWVGGTLLLERTYPHDGDYDSWKAPFEVDLSALATGGRRVSLVIRVISDRTNGGITGPVELVF
ncbi:MAG TPA: DUF4838 domain-containing protein [Chthoniobacteraceae bacterium]|nr:DUF4838 domain-containing protein [Chthoniobacteraceae bacterium]